MSRRQLYYRKGDVTSSVYGLTTLEWQNVKDLASNYDPETCKGLYFYDARPMETYYNKNDTYTIPMSLDGDGDLSINIDGKIYRDFTPEAIPVLISMECRTSAIGGEKVYVAQDSNSGYVYFYPAYVYTDITVSRLPDGCTLGVYVYTENDECVGNLTFTSNGSQTLTNTINAYTDDVLSYMNHYTRKAWTVRGIIQSETTYSHGRFCRYFIKRNSVSTDWVKSSTSYYSNTSATGDGFNQTVSMEKLFTGDNKIFVER